MSINNATIHANDKIELTISNKKKGYSPNVSAN